ncbi:MAG: hypothetical protein HUU20_27505 [Pirellulales bacterium]|nr:hypothetical protein [Pirellulales bacterium]
MSGIGRLLVFVVMILNCPGIGAAADHESGGGRGWYKGNTHCHSLWSDGDEFPEMAAEWYKSHGYHFLALSDHNLLMRGQRWHNVHDRDQPVAPPVIEKCRQRFGPSAVETRGEGQQLQVRLKTFEEVRAIVQEPAKFVMIEAQEINGKCGEWQVHLNAIQHADPLDFQAAGDVVESFRVNLRAVADQAARLTRPVAVHLNHPSWPHYHVTAEDLAELTEVRAFELCNASQGANRFGDAHHPSLDRMWDIANTLRITEHKSPPLLAVASDDAHHYQQFAPEKANPGRGFIMVRAERLAADAITAAFNAGDFYASTGVVLRELHYDRKNATLRVAVEAQAGVNYTIEFIGTPADFDPSRSPVDVPPKDGKPQRPVFRYSDDIGKVLARVEGAEASYRLSGKELYVRAVVRSDRRMANPPAGESQVEEAWCQPVGWEKWLAPPATRP